MNIKNLFKNLLHDAETLSSVAEQSAKDYADGLLETETYLDTAEMSVKKIGNRVELRFWEKSSADVRSYTLPSEYRPTKTYSMPIVVVLNNKYYQGFIVVNTSGSLSTHYYDFGGSQNIPDGTSKIFGTCVYLVGGGNT